MVAAVTSLHGEQEEIERMRDLFERQRAAFRRHPWPAAGERVDHLQRLRSALIRYTDKIASLEGIKYNRVTDLIYQVLLK